MKFEIGFPLITFALLSGLSLSTVNAQSVIKRIKCADIDSAPESILVYRNHTTVTRNVSIQIVRDGCRPKLTDGALRIQRFNIGAGDPTTYTFIRHGKFTDFKDVEVEATRAIALYFESISGAKTGGTLDLVLTAD